jgi:cytochrome c oxidase assembly factor CtaG
VIGFPFDPSVYAGLLALFLGHALLARGREVPTINTLYFLLGLFVLWLGLETPIDVISDRYLDSVHMLQHVLIGIIAPPLLLLGLTPDMAGVLARFRPVRMVTEPVPAQLIAAAVMICWHFPLPYDATLRSEGLHVVEHLTFIGAGLIFWWPVLSATSAHARWQLGLVGKMIYIFIGTLPQDLVGLVLQFSRVPFYEYYARAPRLVPGLDAVTDQTIAGAVLQAAGKLSYLVAGLVIFYRWFAEQDDEADESELSPLPR